MITPSASRPSRHDPAIERAAAEKIAMDCVEWCGEGTAEDWIDDLIKCRFDWDDGYKLARALQDRCHIDPDAALVETLDSAWHYLSTAHRDAVRQWVRDTGFEPAFKAGDVVTCSRGTGPIYRIEPETAEYVVSTTDRQWGRGGGVVVPAEDVRAASDDRSGEADETSTKIEGSAEGESAVTPKAADAPNTSEGPSS